MTSIIRIRGALVALTLLLGAGVAVLAPRASAEDAPKDKAPAGPQLFDRPEAAAKAAVAAAEKNDDAAIRTLVGPAHASFVQDGKDPGVQKDRADFVKKAKERSGLEENEDGSMTLVLGEDRWPFPIPIRKQGDMWYFDAAAGAEEMRMRRIGRNELRAIRICRLYDEAQVAYASKDRDGDGVREYAQRVKSSPGKKDGLYWPDEAGEDPSPFGPLAASFREQGLTVQEGGPVGGYYWRVLTGQGAAAPGGRHSYVINGNQIAGFALVGYPAKYGETGIMTFLISHHGKVYERDLGTRTHAAVRCMRGFNPVAGWTVTTEKGED